MKEKTRNALFGFFVLTAIISLAILLAWFGEAPNVFGTGDWTLTITGTKQIRGIGDGSPVKLNGVEIGRVQQLAFKDPQRPGLGVLIVAKINHRYIIPRGATAEVRGAALGFGAGQIDIIVDSNATGEPLDREAAVIYGQMVSPFGDVISEDFMGSLDRAVDHIGNLAAAWTPVAQGMSVLLEERSVAQVTTPGAQQQGITPNLVTVVERIDRLLANVNNVLGDKTLQGDAKATVSELKTAAEDLRKLVGVWADESRAMADNVNEGIDRTEANFDRSFHSLNDLLERLDDGATSAAIVLAAVARGEGSAGLFARDERLYEAAVLSLERLSDLIASLNRITGKIEADGYIKVGPTKLISKKLPVAATDAGKP